MTISRLILGECFSEFWESFLNLSSPLQEESPDNFSQSEVYPPSLRTGGLFSFGLFWLFACREPDPEFHSEVVPEDTPNEVKKFLPGITISRDYRVEWQGTKKTIWLNIEKKSSEDIVLRGYSFSPRTQSKNPDDDRFDVVLQSDGTLTGRIKDARDLGLDCEFKNNGPTVLVDKEGRIKKVLSGTLAQACVINGHEIPADYTVTNINFDEVGNPFPDMIPSVCAYNIPSRGSCAFPTDGRLSPMALGPPLK